MDAKYYILFKKSGNIVENWFGRCRREVIRRCNDATTSYRNHYATKNILKQLQNKKNPLNSAISIQTEHNNKLQEYKNDAAKTLLESEQAIDQSEFTNSFISSEYDKNVYILGNVL